MVSCLLRLGAGMRSDRSPDGDRSPLLVTLESAVIQRIVVVLIVTLLSLY